MRILVTGGAGFLGRHVVQRLIDAGYTPVAMQRSHSEALARMGVEQRRGDIADAAAVDAAVSGCDAVIHTAAMAGVWGPERAFFEANVTGTRNVIAACRKHGIRRLVHTSTPSVVFNRGAFRGANESLPYGSRWLCHYARTKAQAEQEALAANGSDGLRVCALRPHLIWGVGDPHLLPRVIDRARAGRLRVVGDGGNLVDITHVFNAADAHLQALDALDTGRAAGKAYFLSQGQPVPIWAWINDMLRRLDIPPVQRRVSLRTAYAIGATMECVWRAAHLKGEPPMTRFVAVELAKDHWFSIAAARRDLRYAPENYPTLTGMHDFATALRQSAK